MSGSGSERVWTILSMLEWGTDYFREKGVPNPRLSIEWLLADLLQTKRLDIYLQFGRPLSPAELDKIRPMIKRRALHEPLQYITGSTDFMGLEFRVTPDVLIPRGETEQLVELLAGRFGPEASEPLHLLDIGTGSGCIPVSLKKKFPAWTCAGLDISVKALALAKENARLNGTEVDFYHCDINHLESHPELSKPSWEIVISNPPYITGPEKKEMEKEVTDYEPADALFHNDPLSLYSRIIGFAAARNSALFLECNDKFAADILKLSEAHFSKPKLLEDLDGNSRFVVALQD